MERFKFDIDQGNQVNAVSFAKQGDNLSREVILVMTRDGAPYTPPTGTTYSVQFGNKGMPSGWYDTITVGSSTRPAVTRSANELTVELIGQALTKPGVQLFSVIMMGSNGYQLGSWNLQVEIEATPGYGSGEIENYYNMWVSVVDNATTQADRAEAQADRAETLLDSLPPTFDVLVAEVDGLKEDLTNSVDDILSFAQRKTFTTIHASYSSSGVYTPASDKNMAYTEWFELDKIESMEVSIATIPNIYVCCYKERDESSFISPRKEIKTTSAAANALENIKSVEGCKYFRIHGYRSTAITADEFITSVKIALRSNLKDEIDKKLDGVKNVTAFGCVGDGATDNLQAFRAAVESGGIIYIPDGIYNVTISDNRDDNIVVGDNTHIILSPNALIRVTPSAQRYQTSLFYLNGNNITIEGGKIAGNNDVYTPPVEYKACTQHGITVTGGKDIIIRDMEIYNFNGWGVYTRASSVRGNSKRVTIENCYIHDTSANGIAIVDLVSGIIRNCTVERQKSLCCIDFEPSGENTTDIENVIVDSCRFNVGVSTVDYPDRDIGFYKRAKNVRIMNSTMRSAGVRRNSGSVTFESCNIGLLELCSDGDHKAINCDIDNLTIIGASTYLETDYGRVTIDGCTVNNDIRFSDRSAYQTTFDMADATDMKVDLNVTNSNIDGIAPNTYDAHVVVISGNTVYGTISANENTEVKIYSNKFVGESPVISADAGVVAFNDFSSVDNPIDAEHTPPLLQFNTPQTVVKDVRAGSSTSVVGADGIAVIPIGSYTTWGVTKKALASHINSRSVYFSIDANQIDYGVKAAMSAPVAETAGMIDGVYHYPAWTLEEQAAAQQRLGIREWKLISEGVLETASTSNNINVYLHDETEFVIQTRANANESPSNGYIVLRFDNSNTDWYFGPINWEERSNMRNVSANVIVMPNGFGIATWYEGANAIGASATARTCMLQSTSTASGTIIVPGAKITRISIRRNSSTFPAGFEYHIYGR